MITRALTKEERQLQAVLFASRVKRIEFDTKQSVDSSETVRVSIHTEDGSLVGLELAAPPLVFRGASINPPLRNHDRQTGAGDSDRPADRA